MKNSTRTSATARTFVRRARIGLAATWLTWLLTACGDSDGETLKDATVTVACANCVFHMEGAVGCPFAAEIDGKHFMIQGRVPEGHESHAPDGICNMPRRAKVDGQLRDGKLITTRMELLPATEVPEHPRFSADDIH